VECRLIYGRGEIGIADHKRKGRAKRVSFLTHLSTPVFSKAFLDIVPLVF